MDVERTDPLKRAPHSKPPFTLSELKKAIPAHCFKRSAFCSFTYLFHDLAAVFTLYHAATSLIQLLPTPLRYISWPIYWAAQGTILTGLSQLGHEAGHNLLSDHRWLDDVVGLALHSALLVPYFGYKYSHARHHVNVGSLEKEELIASSRRDEQYPLTRWLFELGKWSSSLRGILVLLLLVFAEHLYFAVNAFGRPYDRFASHFYPWSPIFTKRQRFQIFLSDLVIVAILYFYYQIGVTNGWAWFMCVIGGPLLVHNALLISLAVVTHIHPSLPRYDVTEWDWLRGALSTVDRDWGFLNHVFHHVADCHVVHHLFSTIPHYHAVEATRAIKPILGEYYRCDATPLHKAVFRDLACFGYMDPHEDGDGKGVYWFAIKK